VFKILMNSFQRTFFNDQKKVALELLFLVYFFFL
jgi:hypothetical protein